MIVRRLPAAVASLVAAALLLAACGSSDTKTTSTAAAPKRGTIRVLYATPQGPDEALAQTVLSAGGTAEVAKALVDKRFKMPWDMKVVVRRDGSGPFYDPSNHTINLDYNFVDFVLKSVKENDPSISDRDLGEKTAAINAFVFLHEFGHALVDAYDLPITGREEDAVDQLATVLLTQDVKGGDVYSLDAAEFFNDLQQNPSNLKAADFFDEHSLDAQRAYSIVCWVAGSSEAAYKAIEAQNVLSKARLEQCPAEYQQKVNAWKTLLAPHAG